MNAFKAGPLQQACMTAAKASPPAHLFICKHRLPFLRYLQAPTLSARNFHLHEAKLCTKAVQDASLGREQESEDTEFQGAASQRSSSGYSGAKVRVTPVLDVQQDPSQYVKSRERLPSAVYDFRTDTNNGRQFWTDAVVSVSSTTEVRACAGSIAQKMRQTDKVLVRAANERSIYTAARALATARSFVGNHDALDIHAQITMQRMDDDRGYQMRLYLYRVERKKLPRRLEDIRMLRVGSSTSESALAGAVVNELLQTGICRVSGAGQQAVFKALRAASLTRMFLRREENGDQDLVLMPYWINVPGIDGNAEGRMVEILLQTAPRGGYNDLVQPQ